MTHIMDDPLSNDDNLRSLMNFSNALCGKNLQRGDRATSDRGRAKAKKAAPQDVSANGIYAKNFAIVRSGNDHLSEPERVPQANRRIVRDGNGGGRFVRSRSKAPDKIHQILRESLDFELLSQGNAYQ
jgi:hypothetical protein